MVQICISGHALMLQLLANTHAELPLSAKPQLPREIKLVDQTIMWACSKAEAEKRRREVAEVKMVMRAVARKNQVQDLDHPYTSNYDSCKVYPKCFS